MSVRAMQAVWQHSRQSGGALVLLLAIADNAHDDGDSAYPSIETLAKKARMTERNVNILLKQLEASGELVIRRGAGPRGTNIYRVNLIDGPAPENISPEKISPPKEFQGEKSGSEGVKNPARGGEAGFRGGVKPISPKPSLNRQREPSGEPSVLRAPARRPPDLLFEAMCDVCGIDWRKLTDSERGKVNAATTQIRKAGGTPDDIHQHAENYTLHFTTPLTPNALAGNWAKTANPPTLRAVPRGSPPPKSQNGFMAHYSSIVGEEDPSEPDDVPAAIDATFTVRPAHRG